jgi:sugar phosphate isomerase/epimerase
LVLRKMGESYESMYSGGYSSLSPEYGNFIGYRLSAAQIGFPGSAQTANQLGEAVNAFKQGVKTFEVTMAMPDVAEQIPKEHFKEIAALSKLAGVKPSVHAPIVDPAGFGERGWDGELAREDAERRLLSTIEKAYELDKNGNVPVVIHSTAATPGNEYVPNPSKNVKPGDEERFYERKIAVIDQDSKQITGVQEERKFYPGRMKEEDWEKGRLVTAKQYLENINENQWEQKMTNVGFYQKEAEEALRNFRSNPKIKDLEQEEVRRDSIQHFQEDSEKLAKIDPQSWANLQKVNLFLDNNKLQFQNLFHNAYKYSDDENQKKVLKDLSKSWEEQQKKLSANPYQRQIEELELFNRQVTDLFQVTRDNAPKILKPVEEFAMEKSAETFGNVAFKSYEKFRDNAPILAVENMFQGMAFSRAEDLAKLIQASRDKFAEKLVEEKHMSKDSADELAKKFIGATWDVGHLNMMKKHGFTDEDVVAETKKVAKYVKHIHLTDNFGYSDSHLAPGMGNVPFKDILKELEKTGKLDQMRKIVEAPGFFQHFKKSPHPYVLSAFGSGIYGAKMAPYWNQAMDMWGGYFGYPMAYLPEKHFQMYGSGFSGLPEELGGQMPGTGSRFSGTPNA